MGSGAGQYIEQFSADTADRVLAWDSRDDQTYPANVAAFVPKGEAECIRLVLADGRQLLCTPNHRVLVCDSSQRVSAGQQPAGWRWVAAQDITDGMRVGCSVEAPVPVPLSDTERQSFVLTSGDLTLRCNTPVELQRTLAYVRLLGYLNGDGSLFRREREGRTVFYEGYVVVRHQMAISAVRDDIRLLTGLAPAVCVDSGLSRALSFRLSLPQSLSRSFATLAGQTLGDRVEMAASSVWPAFLTTAPRVVVQEFLGGLFGADGHSPYLRWEPSGKAVNLVQDKYIGMLCANEEAEVAGLKAKMTALIQMMQYVGVTTELRLQEEKYTQFNRQTNVKRAMVSINVIGKGVNGLEFARKIGFRYDGHKQMRLTAAAAWWRLSEAIVDEIVAVTGLAEQLREAAGGTQVKAKYLAEAVLKYGLHNPILGGSLTTDFRPQAYKLRAKYVGSSERMRAPTGIHQHIPIKQFLVDLDLFSCFNTDPTVYDDKLLAARSQASSATPPHPSHPPASTSHSHSSPALHPSISPPALPKPQSTSVFTSSTQQQRGSEELKQLPAPSTITSIVSSSSTASSSARRQLPNGSHSLGNATSASSSSSASSHVIDPTSDENKENKQNMTVKRKAGGGGCSGSLGLHEAQQLAQELGIVCNCVVCESARPAAASRRAAGDKDRKKKAYGVERHWNGVPAFGVAVAKVDRRRRRLPVYDLTVPSYNSFTVNGIVVHNCGGQDTFMENYFESQKDAIFRNVEVLIYVFDIESPQHKRDMEQFLSCVEMVAKYSSSEATKVYCLIHKMDLIHKEEDRLRIYMERDREIKAKVAPFFSSSSSSQSQSQSQSGQSSGGSSATVTTFATSIWDETLYKAWSAIVHSLIPNVHTLERQLVAFCNLLAADEVVLFEKATFLVICSAVVKHNSDAHRYEKISNIIKQFKLSCSKSSNGEFLSMQVQNKHFIAFIDQFTTNTYIMIVGPGEGSTSSSNSGSNSNNHSIGSGGGGKMLPAAVQLNLKVARPHFERFVQQNVT